jgi:hypothetical protein
LLLLDRIRRLLESLANDVEDAGTMALTLRRRYGVATIDGVKVPRLRMGTDLNDYWLSVILGDEAYIGPPLIGGQRRLRDAAGYFDEKLAALLSGCSPSEQVGRLRELQKRVTSGLGFLVYEVASAAEVGMIFETLNERGRQLTDLEKTKNYLLYLARTIPGAQGEDLADKINHSWSQIFANLATEPDGMDDQLLRAHWLATQDPSTREWKRIASIKTRFDRSLYVSSETRLIPVHKGGEDQAQAWEQLYNDVSGYIASLRACSFFMAEMFDEHGAFEAFDTETRIGVRRRSAALRRSGVVAIWRPLLFAARLAHPTDGQLYFDLVDLCERYSARVFVIEQRRANAGEGRLLRLAYELHNGKDPSRVLEEMRDVLWTYAPDGQVSATMESTSENWYGRRGHKYVLYEYELSLMSPYEELPALSWFTEASKEQRTTEHILPQHPDPDATCWSSHFSDQDHARLCHSLGNLALTLDNSSYSNKCFADKRGAALVPGQAPTTCYAQGKLHQEQRLAAYADWTPETIEQRQKELAAWALEHWAVEPPSGGMAAEGSIDIENEGTDEDLVTEEVG